jgi:hypothetical protein
VLPAPPTFPAAETIGQLFRALADALAGAFAVARDEAAQAQRATMTIEVNAFEDLIGVIKAGK